MLAALRGLPLDPFLKLKPAAWWLLDEPAESTTAADATSHGSPAHVAGSGVRFGAQPLIGPWSSVFFDGCGALTGVASETLMSAVNGRSLTILFWAQADTIAGRHTVFSIGGGDRDRCLTVAVVDGAWTVDCGGHDARLSAAPQAETCHSVVVTIGAGRATLYLPGAEPERVETPTPNVKANVFSIGATAQKDVGDGWEGRLSRLMLVGRALSEAEIRGLPGVGA